mmetsp:Transcript_46140/g.122298  ORF Transcript_46140/g.122298 Transcript_46140/m.122298 type:complete len:237 (-) Transcript_46140:53-763(-)
MLRRIVVAQTVLHQPGAWHEQVRTDVIVRCHHRGLVAHCQVIVLDRVRGDVAPGVDVHEASFAELCIHCVPCKPKKRRLSSVPRRIAVDSQGIRLHRCVKSVAVSVVSGSAHLVMEDVHVCRACDPLEHLSHLSIVDICDFLRVIVKIVRAQACLLVYQLERVCIQSHVQTATIMHNRVHATNRTLEHVLGNTLRKSLFRSGLIRNKVVTLTVVNSVLQRGTDIRDSDVRHLPSTR